MEPRQLFNSGVTKVTKYNDTWYSIMDFATV